jgi:cardiolipin synthase
VYNLPNLLTLSRIVVIPVIFLSLYLHSAAWSIFAACLFVVASVTDYFDGYLARRRHETSAFGRLLDPIADKLLVASALVVILGNHMVLTPLTYIPVFVILCREILVSGLRKFLREVNVGLPVTRLAKWKTGCQMTALSMILFKDWWCGWQYIGEVLLWIAGILTFITGYQYFQKSLDYIRSIEKAKTVSAVKPAAQKAEPEPKADTPAVVKRKPGRPKKAVAAKAVAAEEPKKRGRGRPKKTIRVVKRGRRSKKDNG